MTVANVEVSIGDAEDPLVITSQCEELGIQWTDLSLPEWSLRMLYAPPSGYIAGNVLLSAVEDAGDLALAISVQGSSIADLQSRKNTLRNALAVWPGEVTIRLVEDSGTSIIAGPWQSFPTVPRWGEVTALLSGIYYQDATVSIPVNPEVV